MINLNNNSFRIELQKQAVSSNRIWDTRETFSRLDLATQALENVSTRDPQVTYRLVMVLDVMPGVA